MDFPGAWIEDNLMWTTSGAVWALWRINPPKHKGIPVVFSHANEEQRQGIRSAHQGLYQALRGEALLLGLCSEIDRVEIAERQLVGIDISDSPEWTEEIELYLEGDEEDVPFGGRSYYLAIPLTAPGWRQKISLSWYASVHEIESMLALSHRPPSQNLRDAARAAAALVEESIPDLYDLTPGNDQDYLWIAHRCSQRGTAVDVPPSSTAEEFVERFSVARAFPTIMVDEGALGDAQRGERLQAHRRRYLKVDSNGWDQPSYQVMLGLTAGPKGGWDQNAAWLNLADQMPFEVDWVQRLSVSSAREVTLRNKRAETRINEQYKQTEDGPNSITGPGRQLDQTSQDLVDYTERLNAAENEVEVRAAVIFAVAADTAEDATHQARLLVEEYKGHHFTLKAELGEQEHLWWAFAPGVPTTRYVRELEQLSTGHDFATSIGLTSAELGDATGYQIGVCTASGRPTPVLRNPTAVIAGNSSPSCAVIGEKGGGKTVFLKDDMGAVFDRHGRVLCLDRTPSREYARFAKSLRPEGTEIVDLLRPTVSLDPLRMLGVRRGATVVQSLFNTVLDVSSNSDLGGLLSEVLEEKYLTTHGLTSLNQVVEHLRGLDETDAKMLARRIRTIASKDIGAVLFDDSLPPANVNAQALIFLTAGFPVPSKNELLNEHLYERMPMEKVLGHGLHAMLINLIREIAFEDKSQFVAAYLDECYSVTSSPEGEAQVILFLRDDRKHNAALLLGAQDTEPLGSEALREAVKFRVVTRQTSQVLAFQAVKWLTSCLHDEDVNMDHVNDVMSLSPTGANNKVLPGREGEALVRDQMGRIGPFKKTLPKRPERRAALFSTPSQVEEFA